MVYQVETTFPTQEAMDTGIMTSTKQKNFQSCDTAEEVIAKYNDYSLAGYGVTHSILTDQNDNGEELDVFELAEQLTQQGIDYVATLKIKSSVKGEYDTIAPYASIIESHGYDYEMNANLKVNDVSPVNINNVSTWTSQGATYSLKPKVKSSDIRELKSVFDALNDALCDTVIDLKPKKQSDEDAVTGFAAQLMLYPDDATIKFTLKDVEM